MKRKRYSRQFQRMAVDRMKTSENIGALAHELGDLITAGVAASRRHPDTLRWQLARKIQNVRRYSSAKFATVRESH